MTELKGRKVHPSSGPCDHSENENASLVAQTVKNLPANAGDIVQSLGWEDPLEKEMATHASILTWKIPWTEEPDGLQSTGSQKNQTGQNKTTTKASLTFLVLRPQFSAVQSPSRVQLFATP